MKHQQALQSQPTRLQCIHNFSVTVAYETEKQQPEQFLPNLRQENVQRASLLARRLDEDRPGLPIRSR